MSALTYRRARLAFLDISYGLWKAVALFVAIVAVIFLVIGLGLSVVQSEGDRSIWENSAYATRYFPLAMGIMITGAYLPVAIASGLTRRAFGWAGSAVVLALAGVMALLEAVGYLVEYGLYALLGRSAPTYTTPHLFDQGYEFWIIVPEVWIVVAANVAAGWLIGTAYYKWRWLGPTLALPLLLIPMLTVEAIMSVGWAGAVMEDAFGVGRMPSWLAVTASLLLLAVTLGGIQRLNHTVDVRAPRT